MNKATHPVCEGSPRRSLIELKRTSERPYLVSLTHALGRCEWIFARSKGWMTAGGATSIAGTHLARNPIGPNDYVWIVGEPRKFANCWHFGCKYRCLLDLKADTWGALSGAPGVIILPDKIVGGVGWDELADITRE